MLSKSSRNLNRRSESLDLQIPHRRSREKEAPTHRTKDRERMDPLRKPISPSHKQRRVMRRQRKTLGSGVNSIKFPNITLMNVAQKSLVVEMKASELEAGSDSKSDPDKGKQIIDAETSAIDLQDL
jgi:hypothetical protein